MKPGLNQWLWCFLIASLSTNLLAESPIWKVSKGDQYLYLGGTVHILSAADYPLPAAFEKVYRDSQQLVLETDMQELLSPAFQQRMLSELSYANHQSLATVLSEKTYQKLEQYCKSRGIAVDTIKRFKPMLASMVLLMLEMQRLGLAGQGVDEFYYAKARVDEKLIGQLETVEDQLNLMATMAQGMEDQMIKYTLRDVAELPSIMQSLKLAWRVGDMPKLAEMAIKPYAEEFPQAMDAMLNNRNRAWLPKIESMLSDNDVELVLVGVLHLAGEQGLLSLLESRGYRVTQQ